MMLGDTSIDYSLFVTVDESEQWLANSKHLCGSFLKETDKVSFIRADRIINGDVAPPEIKYDFKFSEQFDLVLIDGPSMRLENIRRKDAINTNIFEAIGKYDPKVILVDIRSATVNRMVQILKDKYIYKVSDAINRNYYTGYSYFSVFLRKDF